MAVVGHALAQGRGQSFHLAREAAGNGVGTIAVHLAKDNEAVDNMQRFWDYETTSQCRALAPTGRLGLLQRLDHRCLQAVARLGVDHGIYGLVVHMGRGVIGFHAPLSLRDLPGRPAPMNQMVEYKAVKRTALDQSAEASAARPALVIHAPRCNGATGLPTSTLEARNRLIARS